ncbi:hypothetical protein OG417_11490 [Actinoallomurus sp. NBC_01490]|uniref:hypothetical protein n=1 Tax=Actinoallomurus sp. NBC_01490 TaxID=2903557 RepID=UPI002E3100B3|nr:hypothetical protein [Actinoallomurus sp. NBC_01490]
MGGLGERAGARMRGRALRRAIQCGFADSTRTIRLPVVSRRPVVLLRQESTAITFASRPHRTHPDHNHHNLRHPLTHRTHPDHNHHNLRHPLTHRTHPDHNHHNARRPHVVRGFYVVRDVCGVRYEAASSGATRLRRLGAGRLHRA